MIQYLGEPITFTHWLIDITAIEVLLNNAVFKIIPNNARLTHLIQYDSSFTSRLVVFMYSFSVMLIYHMIILAKAS